MKLRGLAGVDLQQELDRHWVRWALFAWACVVAFLIAQRWGWIHWLSLGDTDDNMRLMQVRGLLNGQGWYDLRQYRMNPPQGFNIHWSRLVDLPIAGLILVLRPLLGTDWAERIACGFAPLIPLSLTILGVAFTARRLVDRLAWPVAIVILLGCLTTMGMYMPMRIDHHGWQLACLAATVAGLADPRRARGGAVVGIASAVSLTIGLEMLPYGLMAGAILALRWIWDRDEARRLQVYGATLAGGTALGFAAFTSYDNMAMRCDALTPVWLFAMVAAGAALFLIGWANPRARWVRLVLAAVAGAVIAGAFAHFFPQCVHGRPEQVSDELARTWLDNVREAKPIYRTPWRSGVPIAVLPIIGVLGGLFACWRARRSDRLVGWIAVTLFTAFAAAMLLWQVRAGPAGQLLAVPGATALAWAIVPWCLQHRWAAVRVLGSVAAFLIVSGLFIGLLLPYLPDWTQEKPNPGLKIINRASGRCQTISALRPLDKLPPALIFTHVDLGPRLITITHHDAVAGPYHRNGDAILAVHHAFTGSDADAQAIIDHEYHAAYLLTCPNISESTVYRARNPGGFYAQLAHGKRFAWLQPVALPKGSPLRLWRVIPRVRDTD